MTAFYIAGASSEIVIAEFHMARVRAAGHLVTHDWCAGVRSAPAANPIDATMNQRATWCAEDIGGIERCDVFWLLVPQAPSVGCWCEIGIAYQMGKRIVMSGEWRTTIFSALARELYDTHALALTELVKENHR
jgi:hypothetical protein